jgi:hypothetical protein
MFYKLLSQNNPDFLRGLPTAYFSVFLPDRFTFTPPNAEAVTFYCLLLF